MIRYLNVQTKWWWFLEMLYTNFLPDKNCFCVTASNTFQSSLETCRTLTQHSSTIILWQVGNQHLYHIISSPLYHLAFVLLPCHEKNFNSWKCNCSKYGYAHASAIADLNRKTEVNPTDFPYRNKLIYY